MSCTCFRCDDLVKKTSLSICKMIGVQFQVGNSRRVRQDKLYHRAAGQHCSTVGLSVEIYCMGFRLSNCLQ
jgi:hypothetical protein